MTCTVQNGVSPFADTGTFTFKGASSGNGYTVTGDGVNTADSSGSYSYSQINGSTGALKVNDSAFGVASVYLACSSATAGGFSVKSASTGSYQIGQFVFADTGSLTVSIYPTSAITDGAKWQVDGGTLKSSGTTVSGLSVGSHTVSFTAISGWTTPGNQTVSVGANSTTTTSGTYVAIPQTGSLRVTISPAAATTAGAQWQVDGGPSQTSGATITDLSVGNHSVSFNTIGGWTAPANQNVSIKFKSVARIQGIYTFAAHGIYNGLFMAADADRRISRDAERPGCHGVGNLYREAFDRWQHQCHQRRLQRLRPGQQLRPSHGKTGRPADAGNDAQLE